MAIHVLSDPIQHSDMKLAFYRASLNTGLSIEMLSPLSTAHAFSTTKLKKIEKRKNVYRETQPYYNIIYELDAWRSTLNTGRFQVHAYCLCFHTTLHTRG